MACGASDRSDARETPRQTVLGVRAAWLAGHDGETAKSGCGLLPQISGVNSGSLRGRKERSVYQCVIVA